MPSTSNDAGEDEVMLEQHEGAEGSGGSEAQLVITAIKQLSILAGQQLLNSRDFKLPPDTLNCLRQLTDNLSHLTIMDKPTGEPELPQEPVGTQQISASSSCINSPQPTPGLPTPSASSKKRPGLAESSPLKKRVKRTEGPEPTPQAPKPDAERFAELEDELFGPEPPTEARASELSEQMFGHYSQVPPADVMFEMRAVYLDTESFHRMMVDHHEKPRWLSPPFYLWMDSLKSKEELEFEDFVRTCNTTTEEIEAASARIASFRPQPIPRVEAIRNSLASNPVIMSRPFATPPTPRLDDLLPPELFKIDPAVRAFLDDEEAPETNKED